MRKLKWLALLLFISSNVEAIKNWQAYTNTTHIFDVQKIGNNIYTATWGGLEVYDLTISEFTEKYTSINGLSSNDIRAIKYKESNNTFYIGTADRGIDRMKDGQLLIPVNELLGLASNSVNEILIADSLLFIATKSGLSLFLDNDNYPFPFLVNNYNTDSGLISNDLNTICLANEFLLCGTDLGLSFVHLDSLNVPASWQHLETNNSMLPGSKINSISSNSTEIVIATDNGIYKTSNLYEPDQAVVFEAGFSIYPVFIDQDNNIWLSYGSWDKTLLSLQDSISIAIKMITPDGSITEWTNLETTKIMDFQKFGSQFMASTWGDGIYLFDGEEWSINIKQNCIVSNVITDLKIDQNNKLWTSNGHIGHGMTTKGTKGISCFDGSTWTNFSSISSPLHSDNIYCMEVDQYNRKWFGSWSNYTVPIWGSGISIYDDSNDTWKYINSQNVGPMTSNTVSVIRNDGVKTWVGMYPHGVIIFDENDEPAHTFELYQPDPGNNFSDILRLLISPNLVVMGTRYNGIRVWNDPSFPLNNGNFWQKTPFAELRGAFIFDFSYRETNNTKEIWIASDQGLFMYDGIDWFLYGTNIKKKVWQNNSWFWSQNNPDPTYWYYEGQPRLYGSIPTVPTALFVDPFQRIWIGTGDAGFTVFDPERDTFETYNIDNSPLLSNYITSFSYAKSTGKLFIGTNDGLNSVEIGIPEENNNEVNLNEIVVFPNPFYPEQGEILRIENTDSITMPTGDVKCFIYDLNGEMIIEMEKNIYEQFSWDGTNKAGKKCSSGIYFYLIFAPDGQTARGKIALIR